MADITSITCGADAPKNRRLRARGGETSSSEQEIIGVELRWRHSDAHEMRAAVPLAQTHVAEIERLPVPFVAVSTSIAPLAALGLRELAGLSCMAFCVFRAGPGCLLAGRSGRLKSDKASLKQGDLFSAVSQCRAALQPQRRDAE